MTASAKHFQAPDGATARRFAAIFLLLCPAWVLAQDPSEEYPSYDAFGFADISYFSGDAHSNDDFTNSQLVGHGILRLNSRFDVFAEVSVSGRDSDFESDIERLIAKYTFSDLVKLSAGQFNTPIGYWNTSFHRGNWLQTTAGIPSNSRFIPAYMRGIRLEGNLPGDRLGLSYSIAAGDGRQEDASRQNERDLDSDDAYSVMLNLKPASLYRFKTGVSYYTDELTPPMGPDVESEIYSVYAAWEGETPEVIAEYSHFRYDPVSGPADSRETDAYIFQFAYRLPGKASRFRPYLRYEENKSKNENPMRGDLGEDYQAAIAGLRFDITPYIAFKLEYHREEFADRGAENNFVAQISALIGGR